MSPSETLRAVKDASVKAHSHPSTQAFASEAARQRSEERKRAVLVLAQRFFLDAGFQESAHCLARESTVGVGSLEVGNACHLRGVVREWQDIREAATGHRPALTQTTNSNKSKSAAGLAAAPGRAGATAGAERRRERLLAERETSRKALENLDISATAQESFNKVPPGHPLLAQYSKTGLDGAPVGGTALTKALAHFEQRKNQSVELDGDDEDFGSGGDSANERDRGTEGTSDTNDYENTQSGRVLGTTRGTTHTNRVLKPPPAFAGDAESKELAKTLTRDIFQRDPNVRWSDVVGLTSAKSLLKEAVVMPVLYPQFFHGLLTPWRGVLLYGPPGTGKTMLAKAVATECGTTFFNISASSVVSKWRGDSEKLVRTLFTLARHHAPSTVFLDEIDAVFGSRDGVESSPGGSSGSSGSTVGSVGNDHEASRRMKTELLIQLDGVSRVGDEDGLVFLLAATNLPWALDNALLRRLEKRIFVDLPNLEARRAMFTKLLAPHTMDEPRTELLDKLATHTENFSGSDVTTLCKECAMRPLRRLMVKLDALGALDGTATTDDDGSTNATDDENAADIASIGAITTDDVSGALSQTRSTHTEAHARRYTQWTESFGTAT